MNSSVARGDSRKDTQTFINLLIPNQKRIQGYIFAIVPNVDDAEDLYQETVSEMWNKFDSFQIGTDFVAWSVTIAKYKVLTFRRKNKNSKVQFSTNVCEIIEMAAVSKTKSPKPYLETLRKCMRKLTEGERFLIKLRYEEGMTFRRISARMGKTAPAVHRSMAKLYSKLTVCIRRNLRSEEEMA